MLVLKHQRRLNYIYYFVYQNKIVAVFISDFIDNTNCWALTGSVQNGWKSLVAE